jgi:hypothetical protein
MGYSRRPRGHTQLVELLPFQVVIGTTPLLHQEHLLLTKTLLAIIWLLQEAEAAVEVIMVVVILLVAERVDCVLLLEYLVAEAQQNLHCLLLQVLAIQ